MTIRRNLALLALAAAAGTAGIVAYNATPTPEVAAPQTKPEAHRQRLLSLEGGQNFRDLGGYRTSDGRTVRWGLLYRSGSMHHLTAKDFETLRRLGIKTVCDLRDTGERSKEPVAWPSATSPTILAADYSIEGRGLGIPETVKPRNAAEARKVMRDQYAKMLPRFAPQYRAIFQELLAGDAPLAFNCSAGKDRTGVAAALLLTALGVPRPTVMEDSCRTAIWTSIAPCRPASRGQQG